MSKTVHNVQYVCVIKQIFESDGEVTMSSRRQKEEELSDHGRPINNDLSPDDVRIGKPGRFSHEHEKANAPHLPVQADAERHQREVCSVLQR